MEKRVRIKYLDIAKGIGILFVLMLHSCGVPFFDKFICAFFMPLFFFISGYLCEGIEKKQIKDLMKRRAYKLLKPYFIYNIVLACIFFTKYLVIDHDIKPVAVNLVGIFYSRDYIKDSSMPIMRICNNALWFLTAMFVSYFIFYSILIIEKRKGLKSYWFILPLILITVLLNNLTILLPWSMDSAFLCAFFMLSGYYAKNIRLFNRNYRILEAVAIIIISLVTFTVIAACNGSPNLAVRAYGDKGNASIILYAITGVIGSALCICISKLLMNIGTYKILDYIGRNTMPLLAYHFLVFSIYNKIVAKLFNVSMHVILFDIMRIITTVIVIVGCKQIILMTKKKVMSLNVLQKYKI